MNFMVAIRNQSTAFIVNEVIVQKKVRNTEIESNYYW